MNKKVLITGGAGFIGLNLANKLLDQNYSVHIIDNFARGVYDVEFETTVERERASFSKINLLSIKDINNLDLNYDVIFHLAAIIGVSHVMERPFNVLYDNIQMLGNMIDFARRQKNLKRFFFASTSEVYAGTLKHFRLAIPTPEDSPLAVSDISHARTSYMLSKIYGEALCHNSGIPFTLFRPHNIYGPRMGMSHVIPEQLYKAHCAKEGESIEVFSTNHTRSFCYIDDAIEMIFRMMNLQSCEGMTLNLGTQSPEITMEEVAEACFNSVGKRLFVDAQPAASGSPIRRAPDMSQTKKLINYTSQFNLSEGIRLTYDWYSKNIFDGNEITAK